MDRIFKEIKLERRHQDAKWGDQSSKPDILWNAILGEEAGEVQKAALEAEYPGAHREVDPMIELRRELIQVAAVAVAWIEALDKRGLAPLPRADHRKEIAWALRDLEQGRINSAKETLYAVSRLVLSR